MFALRIHDGTNKDPTAGLAPGKVGGLSFDLAEVLSSFRSEVIALVWTCEDLECFGGRTEELYDIVDSGASITGTELLTIAETLSQVIDGHFVGRDPMTDEVRADIRAIDSAWWEVRTPDSAIVDAIRARFRAVEPFDERAA